MLLKMSQLEYGGMHASYMYKLWHNSLHGVHGHPWAPFSLPGTFLCVFQLTIATMYPDVILLGPVIDGSFHGNTLMGCY